MPLLKVRHLPSTSCRSPAVSVVVSSTRSSSIAGTATTSLWPISSFWGVRRYQVPAVSLPPHFRVQPCLWPYPVLSWCLKWTPSPLLPPMMPWLPVCFPPALAICSGTQFAEDPGRCSCNKLSAAPRILAFCTLPPPHAKGCV